MSRIYYVSSVNGKDGNDGSAEHPFQTLAAVRSLDLQPGDEVLWNGDPFSGGSTCI